MEEDKTRIYFKTHYPELTEQELDECCANLTAFVRVMIEIQRELELPTDHH